MDIEGIRAKSNQTPSSAGLKRYLWAIALTWTILLGIVLAAGIEEMRRHILDLAYSDSCSPPSSRWTPRPPADSAARGWDWPSPSASSS
jgi:hypothetical protein